MSTITQTVTLTRTLSTYALLSDGRMVVVLDCAQDGTPHDTCEITLGVGEVAALMAVPPLAGSTLGDVWRDTLVAWLVANSKTEGTITP